MIQRISGFITDIVRHNDRFNVVTLYTRQRGRMAFMVPVGKSKAGRLRNSSVLPMAVISADINFREGKELYTLRQLSPERLWHDIYSNPLKSSILFFITEFCNRLLRQYPPDEKLWAFITGALEFLEKAPSSLIANFHLAFLVRLAPIVGIEPSAVRWERGDLFDMLSGEMVAGIDSGFLSRRLLITERESSAVPSLLRMNFRNMHFFRFNREQRNKTLDRILEYYSVHLSISRDYKSLDVLREMFD